MGKILKIISGGQTGVDRAALEAAISRSLPWGGWCPKGRLSEDGQVPERFFSKGENGLVETESSRYQERTKLNIRDGDATLLLVPGRVKSAGTKLTLITCRKMEKPYRIFNPYSNYHIPRAVRWLAESEIRILNVAGPRETGNGGLQAQSTQFLRDVFTYLFIYQRWGVKIWAPAPPKKRESL